MTLAAILIVSIFFSPSALPPVTGATLRQSSEQAAPANKPATADGQNSSTTSEPSSSTAPAKSAAGENKPGPPKPRRHKKKVTAQNCVPANATGSGSAAAGTTPVTAPQDPPHSGTAPASTAAGAPTGCPPPKIVVRQGGTSEPAVQLAGGAGGDQAAHQEDTANQMLAATKTNLKKLEGLELTPSQQDIVKQVHQFIEQSKGAVSAGDPERARTLAWKAQLLSEELTKPDK